MTPQDAEDNLNKAIQNLNTAEQMREVYERMSGLLQDQNRTLDSYKTTQKEITNLKRQENSLTKQIEEGNEEIKKITATLRTQIGGITDEQQRNLDILRKEIESYEKIRTKLTQNREVLEQNASWAEAAFNDVKDSLKYWAETEFSIRNISSYLMQVDKGIKSLQLNLGLSGNKADFLRQQMYGATNAAQRYGAGIQDVVELQTSVNDLTGRATVFGESQIANMVLIAKGTGMANAEAGNFVGNMLSLGSSVSDATKLIEGTVNETAKLGLNSSNVLKGISANIGKLNNYRFQNGVEGLKKMVQASEKFKFSMDGAFAAAEKFRTLEGLLQAGAELRVLGGEFAKIDEFKFSFLARNKPEEFAVELAKLTKGMATFNKTTGLFEVSDIDFDKLRVVAESTGRSLDDVIKSTTELNKQEFAKKQIFVGTDEEKEMIAKLAEFGKGSTIGTIQIGDERVNLNEITDKQLELYRQTQKTLKQRAEDSQTFNETFENTMMQFKSTLLPILDIINSTLKSFNGFFDMVREENGKMKSWAGVVPIAIIGLTTGLFKLLAKLPSVFRKIPGIGNIFGGGASTATSTTAMSGSQALGAGKGAMYSGLGSAAQLAALGVAAMGIGYGFKMAAEGAASLSESISKLTGDQLNALTTSLKTLGLVMGGTLIAAVITLGIAGSAGAIGLLAFGAAALMVGAGIGIAAMGVGKMAEGFSTLNNVNLQNIGSGLLDIAKASLMLGNPLSMLGLSSIEESLEDMSSLNFSNIIPLQNLKFIDNDIKNMKMMVDLLNKISSIDTSKLDALGKLFSEGTMKVELVGSPTINNMITVDVDGEKFYKKVRQMIPIQIKKGVQPQGG